jgi:antirestriction protein ArdC
MTSASNVYVNETVEKMLVLLEADVEPWQRGYDPEQAGNYNAHTGRGYRGANILRLAMRARELGLGAGGWLTFNQARSRGGCVKKGEKGSPILVFQPDKREEEGGEQEGGGRRGFAKVAHVFHVSQCEGLEEMEPAPAPMEGLAAKLVEAHGVQLMQGSSPCYIPLLDQVEMPRRASYKSEARYEAVLLHELVHWTGAVGRLHRTFGRFGDDHYALEELVAELGSATLSQYAGLPGLEMQVAYIASWSRVLRGDAQLLWHVMRQAEEAVAYLLAKLDAEFAALDEAA